MSIKIITFTVSLCLNIIGGALSPAKGGEEEHRLELTLSNKKQAQVSVQKKGNSHINHLLTVPDEVTLRICAHICTAPTAFRDLTNVSQVNTYWYRIAQTQDLIPILQQTYFNHLPDEYIDYLSHEEGTPLARLYSLLTQLLSFQQEEIRFLKKIVAPRYVPETYRNPFEGEPIENLEEDYKRQTIRAIQDHEQHSLATTSWEKYKECETFLNQININLIDECLKHVSVKKWTKITMEGPIPSKDLEIALGGSITRLPLEGVNLIKDKIWSTEEGTDIAVFLNANKLRWLPDDLFTIARMRSLNLENNLLTYLPESIGQARDLHYLNIGNFKPLGDRCPCCDTLGRRTSGNFFRVLPESLLQLTNLEGLTITSVGLEEIQDDLFISLPQLRYLNVMHNSLLQIPKPEFPDRAISLHDIGNPIHGFLTMDSRVWAYRLATYGQAPCVRILGKSCGMVMKYFYISVPVTLSLLYYFNGGENLWRFL